MVHYTRQSMAQASQAGSGQSLDGLAELEAAAALAARSPHGRIPLSMLKRRPGRPKGTKDSRPRKNARVEAKEW